MLSIAGRDKLWWVEGVSSAVVMHLRKLLLAGAALAGICGVALAGDIPALPPTLEKIPRVDTTFGDVRVDNYFWLRDRSDPDVVDYLDAENDYTTAVMKPTERLQQKLFEEMVARIEESDFSAPAPQDSFYYYYRTEEGKEYPIYCRKVRPAQRAAPEEVLLDLNELATGRDYLALGAYSISPDHRYLAYSIDTSGSEVYMLLVKELLSGEHLPDTIHRVGTGVEWAADNQTIFYEQLDEQLNLPTRVFRHTLGEKTADDVLVYEETDDAFFLQLHKSESNEYLLIELGNFTTTEYRFLRTNEPFGEFQLIHPRQNGLEYYVTHHGDRFFILTNENALNFRIMEAPVAAPGKTNWKEYIPHRQDTMLERLRAFRGHLVVQQRRNGARQLRVIDLTNKSEHIIDFPDAAYSVTIGENLEFDTNILRFDYQSLVTPKSVYDYDMVNRTRELQKRDVVKGAFDPDNYHSERIFATSSDGVKVPISLVYRKELFGRDGANPLYLYGYGAYGHSLEPRFSSSRLSLLDRGFVFAIAHTRGGGEMGRQWYEDGKWLKKKNSITDFIACAEHLIREKYTNPEALFASGASAGGLLVGAVMNMRPELFKGFVLDVPFVDVLNTMLDPTIPLTVPEYDEWGNPAASREYYYYIKSYAPYENISSKHYPNILVTAGLNDPRVPYWEPAKLTAKLRELKTDKNLLVLKTNMDSGHGGASGRYEYLKEIAFEYAFLLMLLGIEN